MLKSHPILPTSTTLRHSTRQGRPPPHAAAAQRAVQGLPDAQGGGAPLPAAPGPGNHPGVRVLCVCVVCVVCATAGPPSPMLSSQVAPSRRSVLRISRAGTPLDPCRCWLAQDLHDAGFAAKVLHQLAMLRGMALLPSEGDPAAWPACALPAHAATGASTSPTSHESVWGTTTQGRGKGRPAPLQCDHAPVPVLLVSLGGGGPQGRMHFFLLRTTLGLRRAIEQHIFF